MAHIYISQGKHGPARAVIDEAPTEDRDRPVALITAALVDICAERFAQARSHLERALNLDPPALISITNGVVTTTALGYVLHKLDDDASESMLDRSIALDRESIVVGRSYLSHHKYDLARVYAIRGNFDEAIRWLEEAVADGWSFAYTYMGPVDPMLENIS